MPQVNYEERKQAKIDRYRERAERAYKASDEAHARANSIASVIPMGQPILIGHHSERRHRRDLDRIDNSMRKSVELQSKAKHYAERAGNLEAGYVISSDDPDAVRLMKEKITDAEATHAQQKAINRIIYRKPKCKPTPEKIAELCILLDRDEVDALACFKPDVCGNIGIPSYTLSNRNANIRRMKDRLKILEAAETAEDKETIYDGFRIFENTEENRIQIIFPDKPDEKTRTLLKRNGFRWSRYNTAWQRHLNNNGRFAAKMVAEQLTGALI